MARTVTVTFEDGTQHVYENVPDSATPDSVTQRVAQDFGRPVVNIDGGRKEKTNLAQDFGRSAASLADVGINAVTGTLDMLAYPLARAYYGMGMPSDLAAARAKEETTSPKDVIGRALNISQTPQYQGEAARRITGAIGENIVAPAVKAGAQYTGLPEPDVESALGIGSMAVAPGAARAARPVINTAANLAENTVAAVPGVVKGAVQAPIDVASGFGGAITGQIARPGRTPGPLQTPSSRVPLGETYIDPLEWARFKAGEIPIQQVQPRPIQQLEKDVIGGRATLALAGREIPMEGQGMRAFGEALGSQYRRSPITGALDVTAAALTGIPPIASYRAAQGLADWYLSGRGFTGDVPGQYAAAVRQANMGPPRPSGAPVTGPVAPPPIPQQNQMMLPLSNQIARAPEQFDLQTTPGFVPPQPQAQNLQQAVQQAAAARVQGMPPVAGPVAPNPQGQAIIDQIRARAQQPKPLDFDQMAKAREADLALQARKAMGESYQPPKSTAERLQDLKLSAATQQPVEPVVPTYTPKEEAMFQSQVKTAPRGYGRGETVTEIEVMSAERKARESGLRSDELVAKALRQRLDQQTAQGIAPTPKAPPGVIGFITPKENTFHELKKGASERKFAGGLTEQTSTQVRENGVEVKMMDLYNKDGTRNQSSVAEYNSKTGELLESQRMGDETVPSRKYATAVDEFEYNMAKNTSPGKDSYQVRSPDGREVEYTTGGRLEGDASLIKELGIKTPDDLIQVIENGQSRVEQNLQTARPVDTKNIRQMLTDEQKKMWDSLRLKEGQPRAKLIQQLRDTEDPRAQSLADLLEKQVFKEKE